MNQGKHCTVPRVWDISPGDSVRISKNLQVLKDLQKDHGGFTQVMKTVLGKVGKVIFVYPDGDLRVAFGRHNWTFNCKACSVVNSVSKSEGGSDSQEESCAHKFTMDFTRAKFTGPLPPSDSERLLLFSGQGNLEGVREILERNPDKKVELFKESRSSLHFATLEDHLAVMKLLIEAGFEVDRRDISEDTPLTMYAFRMKEGCKMKVVELLLSKGANINAQNERGFSALHAAVDKENEPLVKFLLRQRDCNVNLQDSSENTPLHIAIGNESNRMIDILVAHPTTSLTQQTKGHNALQLAALRGSTFATEKVVQKVPHLVNSQSKDGFAPLHMATVFGVTDMVPVLVKAKACIDIPTVDGMTPLMMAVWTGRYEIVEFLVNEGASLEVVDKEGDNCLHYSAMGSRTTDSKEMEKSRERTIEILKERGNTKLLDLLPHDKDAQTLVEKLTSVGSAVEQPKIMRVLLKKGAKVNTQNYLGKTALHHAVRNLHAGHVRILIEHHCDVNLQNKDGQTALLDAAVLGFKGIQEILCAHPKIDCSLKDKGGFTVLHVASVLGQTQTAGKALTKAGHIVDWKKEDGYTALHLAAINRNLDLASILLTQGGANINVQNHQDETPLILAASKGHIKMVDLLLAKGADLTLRDEKGNTALHGAIALGSKPIVEKLLQHPDTDLLIKNNETYNVLLDAAYRGNNHATEKILAKATWLVDHQKRDGFTALHLAALNGHYEVAHTLLTKGKPSLEICEAEGYTPLLLAVTQHNRRIVELLVNHGANVNTEDREGNTGLHYVIMRHTDGQPPLKYLAGKINIDESDPILIGIALFLCQRGADLYKRNDDGQTPLDLARDKPTRTLLLRTKSSDMGARPKRFSPGKAFQPSYQSMRQVRGPRMCNHPGGDSPVTISTAAGPPPTRIKPSYMGARPKGFSPGKAPQPSYESVRQTEIPKMSSHSEEDSPDKISTAASLPTSKTDSHADELMKMHQRVEDLEHSLNCSICEENPRSLAFGCGHTACPGCSKQLKDCHICRKPIQLRLNLFNS